MPPMHRSKQPKYKDGTDTVVEQGLPGKLSFQELRGLDSAQHFKHSNRICRRDDRTEEQRFHKRRMEAENECGIVCRNTNAAD